MFPNALVFFGVYLCIGVAAVFVGPCADSIREEIRSIRGNTDVPTWKVLAFAIILATVVVVFWPIAVPAAWQSLKQKKLSQRSGLFDLMNAMAVIEPLEGDILPGAKGEYGASPENPVPTRSIMGSRAYLSRLRSRFGDEVDHERIGSFGSGITDNMVDGYRISSKEGEKLGKIYLCPYCTRNSIHAPAGFAMVGDAFLPRPSAEATVADGGTAEDPPSPETGTRVWEAPKDRLLELREAARDKSDARAQYELGSSLVEQSHIGIASSEGVERLVLAADFDHRPAQLLLAKLFREGRMPAAYKARTCRWIETETPTVEERPKPEAPSAAPVAEPGRPKPPRRPDGDFALPDGIPQDKLDFRLFILGVRKGRACLERACEIMADAQLREKHGLDADLGMDRVGLMVASHRGLLERDSERGMADIVDGADPLFDQRRAVFIAGVGKGIEGADPDEMTDQIKAGFPLAI